MITSPRQGSPESDDPTAGHFFLNIDNDVRFLQLFLQTLILAGLANAMLEAHGKDPQEPARFSWAGRRRRESATRRWPDRAAE
jgi:hypothetical protein